MRFPKKTSLAFILVLTTLSILSNSALPRVHAPSSGGNQYTLNSVPAFAQEGTTISLVLTVSLGLVSGTTTYSFRFNVRDPSGTMFQSKIVNQTVPFGESEFSVVVAYPGPVFSGTNSLVGQYMA